jgi:hypothetical protein
MGKYVGLVRKGLNNPWKAKRHIQKRSLDPYRNASVWFNSRYTIGSNIFEQDWDLLIILDACRIDAIHSIKSEYDFINRIDNFVSVGGQSAEWIAKTFDKKYIDIIKNTAYITANPHSKSVLENRLDSNWKSSEDIHLNRLRKYGKWNCVSSSDLGEYERLWRYTDRTKWKYCPPRQVTDRGVALSRSNGFDRTILHYMPPHQPYIRQAMLEDRELKEYEKDPMGYVHRTGDKEIAYNAYLDMLRWVLDDVDLLLKNSDHQKVIITADHGEAFGEYGVYDHHAGSLHPKIRRVPWIVTSSTDSNSYTPEFDPNNLEKQTAEDSLEALGYI